jgi:hypothetical protein
MATSMSECRDTAMNTMRRHTLVAATLIGLLALTGTALAQSTRWDELSSLPFKESYPTPEASARLYDELLFQRAVQVYLWALPAMNMSVLSRPSYSCPW